MARKSYSTSYDDELEQSAAAIGSAVKSAAGGGMFKIIVGIAAVLFLALMVSCSGSTVKSGFVGVRVVDQAVPGLTQSGVQDRELSVGWHPPIPGTYVLKFPTTIRTEVWAPEDAVTSGRNVRHIGPAITFLNGDRIRIGLPIALQVSTDPTRASDLVQQYRFGFDEMISGPVQRELQGAFNVVGPTQTSEQILADGGTSLVEAVRARLAPILQRDGIILHSINVVAPVDLPAEIQERINQLQEAEQNARTQEQQVRVVEAQARQRVAEAEGRARAIQIEGEALRSNPQVARLREIENWNGQCPLDADVCAPGATALVQGRGD